MRQNIKEIWKDIPGYDGMYQVSNLGRVRSWNNRHGKTEKSRILKMRKSNGYFYVCPCKDGKPKPCRVHRLVAKAFIMNPEKKSFINHIDGNRGNNHASNLEWCTPSENAQHSNSGSSKLTPEDVQEIRTKYEKGNIYQHELAKSYDVTQSNISRIITCENWGNV